MVADYLKEHNAHRSVREKMTAATIQHSSLCGSLTWSPGNSLLKVKIIFFQHPSVGPEGRTLCLPVGEPPSPEEVALWAPLGPHSWPSWLVEFGVCSPDFSSMCLTFFNPTVRLVNCILGSRYTRMWKPFPRSCGNCRVFLFGKSVPC